jgi:hypothetical protein
VINNLFELALNGGAERSALAAMNMQITAQMKAQEAMLARQYTPSLYDHQVAMSNYRPPVHVPAGWADWSAHADEMV